MMLNFRTALGPWLWRSVRSFPNIVHIVVEIMFGKKFIGAFEPRYWIPGHDVTLPGLMQRSLGWL